MQQQQQTRTIIQHALSVSTVGAANAELRERALKL